MRADGTDRRRGAGTKRERLRERAIEALLRCGSVREAAQEVGVAASTLLRWLQDSDFRQALEAARERALETAIAQLQQAAGEAVEALRRNMRCGTPTVEVQAARAVLDAIMRFGEHVELRQRVAALEGLVERIGGGAQVG